jgi:hypothetical protein
LHKINKFSIWKLVSELFFDSPVIDNIAAFVGRLANKLNELILLNRLPVTVTKVQH